MHQGIRQGWVNGRVGRQGVPEEASMAEGTGELLVISKTYDLVQWTCRHLANFPRSFRMTLGDRLEHRLYDVLDGLVGARYSRDRGPILRDINIDLELLRFQFRLAADLRCISHESRMGP